MLKTHCILVEWFFFNATLFPFNETNSSSLLSLVGLDFEGDNLVLRDLSSFFVISKCFLGLLVLSFFSLKGLILSSCAFASQEILVLSMLKHNCLFSLDSQFIYLICSIDALIAIVAQVCFLNLDINKLNATHWNKILNLYYYWLHQCYCVLKFYYHCLPLMNRNKLWLLLRSFFKLRIIR